MNMDTGKPAKHHCTTTPTPQTIYGSAMNAAHKTATGTTSAPFATAVQDRRPSQSQGTTTLARYHPTTTACLQRTLLLLPTTLLSVARDRLLMARGTAGIVEARIVR
jgi:hypothetical protein